MEIQYKYISKTYNGEKNYQRDLKKMSAQGWEVVNSETIQIRRGCISTAFWVLLCIITVGILPLIVWAFMGRRVRVIVQYRHLM